MPAGNKVSLSSLTLHPALLSRDADRAGRDNLGGNVTSSIEDTSLPEFRKPNLSQEQVAQLDDWNFRLEKSRAAVEQHVEKRFSQLFMQAVVCYRTNYRYREGHTIHQGLSAKTLNYAQKSIAFQAAHSATVPCLYARSEDTQREIVYLYRSGFYDESNATIDVIKAVNDADRAIDEKYQDSLLRDKVVELLNKSAKGEITPEQASKDFAIALLGEIDKAIEREQNAEVKEVLQLYRDKAELLWSYADHPDNIDRWLNLEMDDPMLKEAGDLIEELSQGVDVSRDRIIALIKRKIDNLPAVICHERHQRYNESRVPFHFYDLYFFQILSRFQGEDLKVVEEATGVDFTALSARVRTFERVKKTNTILAQNAVKIDDLFQELLPLISLARGNPIDAEQLASLSPEKKVCLRPDIYRLRYRMIRVDQEVQSVIKSKMDSILNVIKRASRSKTYLEEFFYYALQNAMLSDAKRKMLCKLLNISSAELEQNRREIKVNVKVHALLKRYECKISQISGLINKKCCKGDDTITNAEIKRQIDYFFDQMKSASNANQTQLKMLYYRRFYDHAETDAEKALLRQILPHTLETIDQNITAWSKTTAVERHIENNALKIREIARVFFSEALKLHRETKQFRRQLMVELRNSHGMSQDHFKAQYIENYPGFPMSDGTMSNLENGLKEISSEIVRQISEIFGVSQSLFYPAHFEA